MSTCKNEQNKKMFLYEDVIGIISVVSFLTIIAMTILVEMPTSLIIVFTVIGFLIVLAGVFFCIKIETETGKYECKHCKHRYVAKYWHVFFAAHTGRTRYLKCPKCGRRSWQKKTD